METPNGDMYMRTVEMAAQRSVESDKLAIEEEQVMATVIRSMATVQPGGRIEIVNPPLVEGQSVEVVVTSAEAAPIRRRPAGMGILEWLDSLPPGPRSADSWEELDRQFQEERNSWD